MVSAWNSFQAEERIWMGRICEEVQGADKHGGLSSKWDWKKEKVQ